MDEKTLEAIRSFENLKTLIIDLLIDREMLIKERNDLREIINVLNMKTAPKEPHDE